MQGNLVGTNVAGDFTWEQNLNGIVVSGTNHTIGGTAANAGNVVAGAHFGNGIEVQGTGHVVQGNWVGIDKTETIDLGNDHGGILVGGTGITIGGVGPGRGQRHRASTAASTTTAAASSSARAARLRSGATRSTATRWRVRGTGSEST